MSVKYIDAHSHLYFSDFDTDREEIVSDMRSRGIYTIAVGTDEKTSQDAIDLADLHENIYAIVGVHPTHDVKKIDISFFNQAIQNEKVVGIGECGLDYFRGDGDKEMQRQLFTDQIEFAHTHKLPLMLHLRPSKGSMDAYEDGVALLSAYEGIQGNAHFFVGTVDIAKKFFNMGMTVSFDGPITFSKDYDEVIEYAPLDMILAETDAPFASPVPYRGKRSEPRYVEYVIQAIAEKKKIDFEKVRIATIENTTRVFSKMNVQY